LQTRGVPAMLVCRMCFSSSCWRWAFLIGCERPACLLRQYIHFTTGRCVIALERTESVGSAPALDFCLEHVNDDFAGDPHYSAAAAQPSSSPLQLRTASTPVGAADVRLSVNVASSAERSTIVKVADTIVSTTAQTASVPLRALSASLSFKRSPASSLSGTSTPDSLSRAPSNAAPEPVALAPKKNISAAFDQSDDLSHADTRRTRSAPAASGAVSDHSPGSREARPPSAVPPSLQRNASVPIDSNAAVRTLQLFASAGRAAVAAVDSALSGVFNEPPPFMCVICSDDFPIELRCQLPCSHPTCSDM
jgi:hypothetical protein